MPIIFLIAVLSVSVSAQSDIDNTVRRGTVPPAKFWLRQYPIRQYAAFAHLEIGVADFDKACKEAEEEAKDLGGKTALPIERDPRDTIQYRQYSFVFTRKGAEKFQAKLRRIGKIKKDTQSENLVDEVPREAAVKLEQLSMERDAGRDRIAGLPSVSALLDELIDHLKTVLREHESSSDKVLVNAVIESSKK